VNLLDAGGGDMMKAGCGRPPRPEHRRTGARHRGAAGDDRAAGGARGRTGSAVGSELFELGEAAIVRPAGGARRAPEAEAEREKARRSARAQGAPPRAVATRSGDGDRGPLSRDVRHVRAGSAAGTVRCPGAPSGRRDPSPEAGRDRAPAARSRMRVRTRDARQAPRGRAAGDVWPPAHGTHRALHRCLSPEPSLRGGADQRPARRSHRPRHAERVRRARQRRAGSARGRGPRTRVPGTDQAR